MAEKLELDVTYAARRPWAPRRAQFKSWAEAALAGAARDVRPARVPGNLPSQGLPANVSSSPVLSSHVPSAHVLSAHVLSVIVVGSARSRALNARYRHKDRPTNVLSFGGPGRSPEGVNYLGELVICAPVVAREASSQGKSPQSHWAHMTVHGVLHLLGFDHERHAEARRMAAREVQILDRLGFSDPYV